jgi:hypothetical protein
MASQPVDDKGMDDLELASLLAAHESKAIGYFDSEIASEQALAIDYYYGKMDDLPALDGCSSVVDNTVSVHVDNALAAVLKPFVSADEVVSFSPRGPEDEEQAKQATEYVNYVITCDNPGFQIFHDWFKDGMLTKLGVVKAWWEDQTSYGEQKQAMDPAQLLEAREHPDYVSEEPHPDGMNHVVTMKTTNPDGRVKVENVPPEEFLISPFARSIETAPYVAHRPGNFTRSALIEMGVELEVANSLPASSGGKGEESRSQARYRDEEYSSGSQSETSLSDKSRDVLAVIDEYVRVDYDGDGISELRRIVRVGTVILVNYEVDDAPFATVCPIPMPHKVYGQAVADRAIQGQKVETAITRQTLDNLYKSNNPRPEVPDTAVNERTWDDIGDSSPGAAISTKIAGQLAWSEVPFTAQHSLPILELMAQKTEERTGFQRKGNGFNAEALKKNSPDTATEASIDENSRNERAEMIARIFAETGVKRLFKLILKLLVDHQPKERLIRLRNKWVPIDPRGWSPDMDLTISVGLGIGNKSEQIQQASTVLEFYQQLLETPFAYLVTAENVHKAATRFFTANGIKNVDDFIADPSQVQPPPPPQDPEMAKAQAQMQIEQAKVQAKMQTDQASHQLEMGKAQAQQQIDQTVAMSKLQIEQAKADAAATLAQQRAEFEARLAAQKMQFDQAIAERQLQIDTELASRKAENDHKIAMKKNREGGDLSK